MKKKCLSTEKISTHNKISFIYSSTAKQTKKIQVFIFVNMSVSVWVCAYVQHSLTIVTYGEEKGMNALIDFWGV